jgi:hypothetical protein
VLCARNAHFTGPFRLHVRERNQLQFSEYSAGQLRHIIAESDHISAAVDSTHWLLKREDMEIKALTPTLEEINKRSK